MNPEQYHEPPLICNKCGEALYDGSGLNEVNTSHNFGSEFDSDRFTFSLCEKCVIDLMLTFTIPPHFSTSIARDINEKPEPVMKQLQRYREILFVKEKVATDIRNACKGFIGVPYTAGPVTGEDLVEGTDLMPIDDDKPPIIHIRQKKR